MQSYQHVHHEFLKKFIDENGKLAEEKILKDYKANEFTTAIRYGNQGELAQEKREQYPCIIITRFTPVPREGFEPDAQPYYADHRDSNNDGIVDMCTRYYPQVARICKYEVDICTKNEAHHIALTQWFDKRFLTGKHTSFLSLNEAPNETIWGTDSGGEVVEFEGRVIAPLVAREDGVTHTLYEINLYPFIALQEPEDVPLIQQLNIGLTQDILK